MFREYLKGYDTGWSWDEYVPEGYWGGGGYWYYWRTVWEGRDDGILSDIEMERIPCSLDIHNIGIKSLKGIEHLTMLTELNCSINQLTALDVSKNIALKTLNCSSNQLTELDVSSNKALTDLRCSGNQLTELNVSSNTVLETLYCENNQLTELDVSSNAVLRTLFCGNNQLTELDVSRNINLTLLECIYNQLSELDVSRNTALTILSCWCNQLTELDMSKNTALNGLACFGQKRRGLNVKRTSEGWQVSLKDYVSCLEGIDSATISPVPVSYDEETGIATFSEPVTQLSYYYMTRSTYNDVMDVTITNLLSIATLERNATSSTPIICNMTDNSYLNYNENALTESDINGYSYSSYGKKGIVADGNSRLILRVQTTKPGTVSFSFNDDIGAKLESLSRKELSASDQLNTIEINSDTHQVSAVLVAPERFPEDKSFPSDTFKVHVKFTDDDGEITEDDLELKLEAAPVILIPGMLNMVGASFFLNSREAEHNFGDADHTFGVNNNSGIWRELSEIGFKKEHIALFDYNSWTSVKNNVNALFDCLKNMFDTYAQEGIVCTKADIVAHGLGGLLVRQYLDESGKDSSSNNNNNWSEISYKQGMIHKVVNIAVPHRGTPLANVMLGDMSVINNDLPFGIDRLAYRVIKYFPSMIIPTFNGSSKETWKDLAVGSDVTNLPFPANVPMHFIYGDVKHSLDELEKGKDLIFMIFNLAKLWKTFKDLPKNVKKLQKEIDPLNEEVRQVITGEKYMDYIALEKITKEANHKEFLKLKELAIAFSSLIQTEFSVANFAENFTQAPFITVLTQIGDVAATAFGGVTGLLTMPIDLYFVIPRLIFSGQAHDKFVPVNSAIAAFPEYSTGFPETSGLWDVVSFEYATLCQQYSVAQRVAYLLKAAPMSEFACKCGCGKNNIDQRVIDIAETIRLALGVPVNVSSGCRCEKHNAKVGGVKGSKHTKGLAADLSCSLGSSKMFETVKKLKAEGKLPALDYCIKYRTFIHIDCGGKRKNLWEVRA